MILWNLFLKPQLLGENWSPLAMRSMRNDLKSLVLCQPYSPLAHPAVFICNKVCVLSCFSRVWVFVTPWTKARQVPLSTSWSRLPFPSPGYLSDPGIKLICLTSPAFAGRFFTTSTTLEHIWVYFWTLFCSIDLGVHFQNSSKFLWVRYPLRLHPK